MMSGISSRRVCRDCHQLGAWLRIKHNWPLTRGRAVWNASTGQQFLPDVHCRSPSILIRPTPPRLELTCIAWRDCDAVKMERRTAGQGCSTDMEDAPAAVKEDDAGCCRAVVRPPVFWPVCLVAVSPKPFEETQCVGPERKRCVESLEREGVKAGGTCDGLGGVSVTAQPIKP